MLLPPVFAEDGEITVPGTLKYAHASIILSGMLLFYTPSYRRVIAGFPSSGRWQMGRKFAVNYPPTPPSSALPDDHTDKERLSCSRVCWWCELKLAYDSIRRKRDRSPSWRRCSAWEQMSATWAANSQALFIRHHRKWCSQQRTDGCHGARESLEQDRYEGRSCEEWWALDKDMDGYLAHHSIYVENPMNHPLVPVQPWHGEQRHIT